MKKAATILTLNSDPDEISTVHSLQKDPLPPQLQKLQDVAGKGLTELAKRRSFFSIMFNVTQNTRVMDLKKRIENITAETKKSELVNIYFELLNCYSDVELTPSQSLSEKLIDQLCENLTLNEIKSFSKQAKERRDNPPSETTWVRYLRDCESLKKIKKNKENQIMKANRQENLLKVFDKLETSEKRSSFIGAVEEIKKRLPNQYVKIRESKKPTQWEIECAATHNIFDERIVTYKLIERSDVTEEIQNCKQLLVNLAKPTPKDSIEPATFTEQAAVTACTHSNAVAELSAPQSSFLQLFEQRCKDDERTDLYEYCNIKTLSQ